jgi:hypothetical protein
MSQDPKEPALKAAKPNRRRRMDERVEEADAESFPASDPPAFNMAAVGEPDRAPSASGRGARRRKG